MFGTLTTIGVATGADWPDALSGGAFMDTAGGPLLLVDPAAGLSADGAAMIDTDRGSDNSAYVFGGPAALPRTVDTTLVSLVSTAAGFVVK